MYEYSIGKMSFNFLYREVQYNKVNNKCFLSICEIQNVASNSTLLNCIVKSTLYSAYKYKYVWLLTCSIGCWPESVCSPPSQMSDES